MQKHSCVLAETLYVRVCVCVRSKLITVRIILLGGEKGYMAVGLTQRLSSRILSNPSVAPASTDPA